MYCGTKVALGGQQIETWGTTDCTLGSLSVDQSLASFIANADTFTAVSALHASLICPAYNRKRLGWPEPLSLVKRQAWLVFRACDQCSDRCVQLFNAGSNTKTDMLLVTCYVATQRIVA